MITETFLQEINQDFINELRSSGRFKDANNLLKAYHQDLKNVRRIELNNVLRQDRLILRSKGFCIARHNPPKLIFKRDFCKECFMKYYCNICKCGDIKQKYSLTCRNCVNRKGLKYSNATKNAFYRNLEKLKEIEINKIYTIPELAKMLGQKPNRNGYYSDSFFIFLKNAISYGIFRKIKKGVYQYV